MELIGVKNKSDAKDKEINVLQISLESRVKLLQADLEASKATMDALQERNQSLDEMHQVTKLHSEDLEKEMDKFHGLTEELREENKVLQDYLEKANMQIQDLQMELSSKVSEYENKLQLVSTDLEEKHLVSTDKQQQAEKELLAVQDLLKQSTESIADLQGNLTLIEQEKQKLEEAKAETEKKMSCCLEELSQIKMQLEGAKEEMSLLAEQLVQRKKENLNLQKCLKEKEEVHCEQIHEVNKKYQHLEQEKEQLEAEHHGLEQRLTRELALLKEKLDKMEQDLQQKQDQLSSIKQEKELSDFTHQQLQALHEEVGKEKLVLEEELEGALDELEQLQLKEVEVEELVRQLEEENVMKTTQLDKLQEELDGKNVELLKVNEVHVETVTELHEEHSKSLRKLGDVEAQFESYRLYVNVELKSLQESNVTLAKELAEFQNLSKEQQQQMAESQLSKDKAREEYARMLLEAQMKLAQKESELRKLQGELEQALTSQVEKQGANAVEEHLVAELKTEVQKWQSLYEELHNKVKPFQEQLDSYEQEKNSLLNEHGAAQEELNKLNEDYAKLLGHQNQKQKIKHVMKLKQENVQLKQEDVSVPDRRVLVTGASGLLGRAVYKEFSGNSWDAVGCAYRRARPRFEKVDLLDPGAVRKIVQEVQPQVVIHCAAERRPDVVEGRPDYSRQLNVSTSGCLARESAAVGAFMIYLSTDYIFDGTHPPYRECDAPNPLNMYGITKLEGERQVLQNHPGAAVLRVPVLYGPVEELEESAVTIIFGKVQCQEHVASIDHWQQRYPTHVADVARVCRQLAERRLQDSSIYGIFHWSGNERMTKYEMARTMADVFRLPSVHLQPVTDPPTTGTMRPQDVHLDCSRLERMGIGQRTPFRLAVKRCLWPFLRDKQWQQTVFH
ncbi:methionine adenosyltransferase 2 subunit beta isoform X2 [Narcine bancroftii]|uniref:methionine adenosyltransferase 2 subunit beta isoform X2 n=1 Tax=Narcine bancroftii TaxID=1343680 RepID=UPI0038316A54